MLDRNYLNILAIVLTPWIILPGFAWSSTFDSARAYEELQKTLTQNYAYLDRLKGKEQDLYRYYKPKFLSSKDSHEFRDVAQKFIRSFGDPHLNLGPYDEDDYCVVPTGSDIWGKASGGLFLVEDVKAGSGADASGVLPNDQIVAIDGVVPKVAIEQVFGRPIDQLSSSQIEYGLNVALGGIRYKKRELKLSFENKERTVHLPPSYEARLKRADRPLVSSRKIGNIGYIRFHNSLGQTKTVEEFEMHLSPLFTTKALIIDLRDIPSGGNTGVAEPILGHFSKYAVPYQLYRTQELGKAYGRSELKKALTKPRPPYYVQPVVVLVGRWTGSMGEGMAIAFDAIGAKAVIGSPMGHLLGGIKTVQLKSSESWLELGFERLYHVNGTFREDFVPAQLVVPADKNRKGEDPTLQKALELLKAI